MDLIWQNMLSSKDGNMLASQILRMHTTRIPQKYGMENFTEEEDLWQDHE